MTSPNHPSLDLKIVRQAQNDALEHSTARHKELIEKLTRETLSQPGLFREAKDKLNEFRKPRLRTVQHYLCDECDRVISSPNEGFIIHGNIYVADSNELGGLIGNNFPKQEDAPASEVKKTVYCKECFLKALEIQEDNSQSSAKQLINQLERKRQEIKRKEAEVAPPDFVPLDPSDFDEFAESVRKASMRDFGIDL